MRELEWRSSEATRIEGKKKICGDSKGGESKEKVQGGGWRKEKESSPFVRGW